MTIYSESGKISESDLANNEKLNRMIVHDGIHTVLCLSYEECEKMRY